MPANVFGAPVTDETLKHMEEYEGKDTIISQTDRARVAMEWSNKEGKRTIAREFLENEAGRYCGDDKEKMYTKCLIYNATGDTVTLVGAVDFEGNVGQSPYPVVLGNGQWGAFLHLPFMYSQGAVLYTGRDALGNPLDWGFGWHKGHMTRPETNKVSAVIGNYREDPSEAWGDICENLGGGDLSFLYSEEPNKQIEFHTEVESCIATVTIEPGVQPLFIATMTLLTHHPGVDENETRAAFEYVFGKAVNNQTLKRRMEFEKKDEKDITRKDRARVAMQMMYAERGGDKAWTFLEQVQQKHRNLVGVMGLIYNATGDTVTLLDHNASEGIFAQSPSPTIENGQWGVFFNVRTNNEYPREAKGSLIYTGKDVKGKRVDFLFSWTNLNTENVPNKLYAEINNYVFMETEKVEEIVKRGMSKVYNTYSTRHRGCFISASIGISLCASFEGIMTLEP